MKNQNSNENKEEILLKMLKAKKINFGDIINFLKTSNIDLNKVDSHGYNLLHYAIKYELCEIVNSFLNLDDNQQTLKADPNISTADTVNSIFLAPIILALLHCNDTGNSSKIIKFLIRAGADLNVKDESDCSLMHKACEKGRIDILELIENKSSEENPINWNETSKNGSAMHMAILGDQEDVINYLLEKKIDLNLRDHNQNTVLHLALQLKNFNVFKLLTDYIKTSQILTEDQKKAIMSATNDEENTILHELAYGQSSVLRDYIIKNNSVFGINLEAKNKQNYTYSEVQKNIIRLKKEREEMEKKKRDMIREEKERIATEIKKEQEMRKKIEEEEEEEERKKHEFRLKLLHYRNYILCFIFLFLMIVLYFLLDSKVKSKKNSIVL